MEIYLLRHGSAETPRSGSSDEQRALTEEGRNEVHRVTAAAKLSHVRPTLVISSPYMRARETAEIAAGLLDCREELLTSDALIPDADPEAVWDEIRVHRDQRAILFAGHEPLFSATAAHLLGDPELRIDFPKAGMLRIDIDSFGPQPRGILKWMLSPSLVI